MHFVTKYFTCRWLCWHNSPHYEQDHDS